MNLNLENKEELDKESKISSNNFKKELISFLKDLVIIIAIVFVIRTFFILPFQISGQSMYDSYFDKEFIIVNRFEYLNLPVFGTFREPARGDVVVFNTHIQDKEYFIKRVIGLPGETLKIQSGSVFVKEKGSDSFKELDEKYLSETNYKATYVRGEDIAYTYEIPENSYFVMGDNRNASTDSRACFSICEIKGNSNYVARKDLVGKVFLDLGFFDFGTFSFKQPNLGIESKPRFFSSPSHYEYK